MTLRPAIRRAARALDAAVTSLGDRRFSSRLAADAEGPVVVLSPHLDDAVLNCWSVLAGDGDVRVVNVFTKSPPPGSATHYDLICGAKDSASQMQARLEEDAAALALAGRAPHNLPFVDAQYRRHRRSPRLQQLDAALVNAVHQAAALYAPAGLGFVPHPDHALVRRLALGVRRNGVPVRLYADLPYAATFGWPHWVTRIRTYLRMSRGVGRRGWSTRCGRFGRTAGCVTHRKPY